MLPQTFWLTESFHFGPDQVPTHERHKKNFDQNIFQSAHGATRQAYNFASEFAKDRERSVPK